MVLGLIMYVLLKKKLLGDIGEVPTARQAAGKDKGAPPPKLTREEKRRIAAIFLLVTFDIAFWLAFEQAGSSMNLFAFERTDRVIWGFQVPASWLQSVNPICILLFGGLFAKMWLGLARRGKEPSTPVKFAMGLFLLGAGFVVLVLGAQITDTGVKAGMFWLMAAYLLHTWGELAISPVGLSMVTKLAPLQFASLLMGSYFCGHFVSHQIAGALAASVEKIEKGELFHLLGGQADFFLIFVITSWTAGAILLLVAKPITKLMHGRG